MNVRYLRSQNGIGVYAIILLVFFIFTLAHWGLILLLNMLSRSVFFTPRGDELSIIDFDFFSHEQKRRHVSQNYGATIFSAFNNYTRPWHNGIDIAAPLGTPIYAATDGAVLAIGNQDTFCANRGFGKFVVTRNKKDAQVLLYAHLHRIRVDAGEKITKGEVIGLVGTTGFATAPHLHFSVFEKEGFEMRNKKGCGPNPEGKDVDPVRYLESLESGGSK